MTSVAMTHISNRRLPSRDALPSHRLIATPCHFSASLVGCVATFILGLAPIAAQQTDDASTRRPPAVLSGQQEATPAAPRSRFDQDLESLRAALAASTDLSDEERAQIDQLLQSAARRSKSAAEFSRTMTAEAKAVDELPAKFDEWKEFLRVAKELKIEDVSPDLPLPDLTKELAELKIAVTKDTTELAPIETAIKTRGDRTKELRERIPQLTSEIAELGRKLESIAADTPSLLEQAQRLELTAIQQSVLAQKSALEAELVRIEAEEAVQFLQLQKDVLTRRIEVKNGRLAKLEKRETELRQRQAREAAQVAKQEQEDIRVRNPLLVPSYEINTQLSEKAREATEDLTQAREQLNKINQRYDEIRGAFDETQSRVATIGLSERVGKMLRKQLKQLPTMNSYAVSASGRDLKDIEFETLDLKELREKLSRDVIVAEIEETHGPQTDQVLEQLAQPIDELIDARRKHLDNARKSLDDLFELSFDREKKEKELNKLAREFRDYINERILWIRSNEMLLTDFKINESDRAVFSLERWQNFFGELVGVITRRPWLFSLSLLVSVALIAWKPTLRKWADEYGVQASKGSCHTFWPTFKTLLITITTSITWPLLLLIFGFGMWWSQPADASPLYIAVNSALLFAAWFAIPVEILRRACRPNGLAQHHFDWSDDAIKVLHRNLNWGVITGAVLVFYIQLLHKLDLIQDTSQQSDPLLERWLFVIAMGTLTVFLFRIFHPRSGVFADYLRSHPSSWATQTSSVWFPAILLMPLTLGGLAIGGFYFTAVNLTRYAYSTFVFAITIELGRGLLNRYLLMRRRHVHIETAKRKKAEQREAQMAAAQSAGESGVQRINTPAIPMEDANAIISENALQARKLVTLATVLVWAAGLWLIWSDVLPALRGLDRFTIWSSEMVVPATEESPASSPPLLPGSPEATMANSAETAEPAPTASLAEPEPASTMVVSRVTVRDLLLFLLISVTTYIAAAYLPSAIEMIFLDDLPVDRSARQAAKALFSYAIVIVGVILALNALSITWSKIQWLATALTFGLAFGLQEIFANFVAGIILMFERPIRIGDLITVDEFTGTVTRIRIRATTIVNWDRKEYVIPNKDFITGRLVNWTLSDEVNRLVLSVGIAYGSDVARAKELLFQICREHPEILADPPTTVTFQEFADSSLLLVLRTFLPSINNRLVVIDELNTRINRAFNEAGIEIAFPQRDLHLRSIDSEAVFRMRGGDHQNGTPQNGSSAKSESASSESPTAN